MTDTDFIRQEKDRSRRPALTRALKAEDTHFRLADGALILGFLAAFIALVLLLSK